MKPTLIKAIQGESIGRFPVWMMRQAGRYLASYQKIRKEHSFWEMAMTPSLAVEVSLLPIKELPLDAVIFFSDILTLPKGMGVKVEMKDAVGPVVDDTFDSINDFLFFESFDPSKHTPFVGESLREIRDQIPSELALLGFAGAPWTLACYLTQGGTSESYTKIRWWMEKDPQSLVGALENLSLATEKYLSYQHESGAHAVQLFDTWASQMPLWFFERHYLPLINKLFRRLHERKLPTIYYTKGAQHLWSCFPQLEVDGLSVDERIELKRVETMTQGKFFLQGNFDPYLLKTGSPGDIRMATRKLVQDCRDMKVPVVMNLGHGILPQTPMDNARAFVEEARCPWI